MAYVLFVSIPLIQINDRKNGTRKLINEYLLGKYECMYVSMGVCPTF